MGRHQANPRRGDVYRRTDHGSRQPAQARAKAAGRLPSLLQIEHPHRGHRGEGQQPFGGRGDAAGARLRRDAGRPFRLQFQRQRLHRARQDGQRRGYRARTIPFRVSFAGAAVAALQALQRAFLRRRRRRFAGLLQRGRRQGAALLPAHRHQPRCGGRGEGAAALALGDGDGHGENLRGLSDSLAAVEGR